MHDCLFAQAIRTNLFIRTRSPAGVGLLGLINPREARAPEPNHLQSHRLRVRGAVMEVPRADFGMC